MARVDVKVTSSFAIKRASIRGYVLSMPALYLIWRAIATYIVVGQQSVVAARRLYGMANTLSAIVASSGYNASIRDKTSSISIILFMISNAASSMH